MRRTVLAVVAAFTPVIGYGESPSVSKYDLNAKPAATAERFEVTLEAGGKVKLSSNGQAQDLPMSVIANLSYDQRSLADDGTKSDTARSVRHYRKAMAAIKVDKGAEQSVLGEKNRLIGSESSGGKATLFCPNGPLTREELDLLDVQGTGVSFDLLLPKASVASGDKWKLSETVLTGLLGLDAVSFADVESMLGDVKQGIAHISGGGAVSGAIAGVNTEIDLKIKYDFDLKSRRVTWLALLIKEKREIGHVGPGLDIVAKVIVKTGPARESAELSDARLAKMPTKSRPDLLQLVFKSPKGDYELLHDRSWYVTAADNDLAVMRLVERGELVAQCNVAKVKLQAADKDLTLEDYQGEVQRALGKNFGQFENAGQVQDEQGRRVYRVVASGEATKLPIHWIYYLVSTAEGQRVSLAFTVESELLPRFGKADRQLASALKLVQPVAETATKPIPAKTKK
jgi:hypothetical protein